MPGLSENFFASTSFTLLAAAVAFLVAAVLLSMIYRLTFGRRLRLPRNGRARLPRLGTVDAFDLDGQRQLVIIRRDNVEHLLIIGGPNDLVIESQIIRAESRDFRESRVRDKDMREPRDAPPLPGGVAWPSPADSAPPYPPQRKMAFPFAAVEPETGVSHNGHVDQPEPGLAPSTVAPVSRPSAYPKPPPRAPAPVASSGQRPPIQREPFRGRAEASQRPEPINSPAKELRRASVATPFLRSSKQRQAEGTAVIGAAGAPEEALPEVPNAPRPHPDMEAISAVPDADAAAGAGPATPKTAPADLAIVAIDSFETVPAAHPAQDRNDTLAAEMAKLLGRGPG